MKGAERGAAPQIQHADPLGGMQFVTGKREHVDVGVCHVDRDLADRLDGIGMKQRPLILCNGRRLLDRKDHPGLVVGVHQRDDGGIRIHRGLQLIHIQPPFTVHADLGDPVPLLGQVAALGQHGRVFDTRGDDMALLGEYLQGRADGGIVALGAAGGKDDLVRRSAQQSRHTSSGPRSTLLCTWPPKKCIELGLPYSSQK